MEEKNYKQLFNLQKKKAFVLGGSGLIGKEITKGLQQLGATITVLDLKTIPLERNINYEKFDLTSKNFEKNFLHIIKKNGCPEIFINAAYPKNSLWKKKSTLDKINLKHFDQNIRNWSNSHIWLSKLMAVCMKKNRIHGKIINIGSIYGVVSQNPELYKNIKNMNSNNIIYNFVKGGLQSFTKQLAVIFGKYNIRINTINSGGVLKIKNSKIISPSKKFIKRYSKNTPLKRMATAQEIASVALFLSSDASSYITGTNIMVDGGWTSV